MKRNLKRTKIICTLGPSSKKEDTIYEMIETGMDIARMNCSHGNRDDKLLLIKRMQQIRKANPDIYFGIAMDTKGPEIRLELPDDTLDIKEGEKYIFCNKFCCTKKEIHFEFKNIKKLKVGSRFSVDDGKLHFKVVETSPESILALACNNHLLQNRKSANFPNVPLGVEFMDQKDRDDIDFSCKNRVNFIFASFVSCKDDIIQIKKRIRYARHKPLVIAKIESYRGLKKFDEILEASDGIMIARGDLFAEVGYKKMFSLQKLITERTKKAKKPVIIATQMIESMITEIVPSRTEITDIGNAVLDDNDCIMTSGETAVGKHPTLVIKTMKNICFNAESIYRRSIKTLTNFDIKKIEIFKNCEIDNTKECKIDAVFVITKTYKRVFQVYQEKLMVPIFVVTKSRFELQKCTILQNVFPVLKSKDILTNNELSIHDIAKIIQKQIENLYNYKNMENVIVCLNPRKMQKVVELEILDDESKKEENKNVK